MQPRITICLLASALGAASLLPAETISGFCRQTGSLNVLPFTLDTDTGAMQTLPAFTIGADRAGHYAAAGLDPGNSTPVIVTGVQSTGVTPEKLVSVNLNNGTVTPSSSGFSNVSFTGNNIATMPGVNPWTVLVTQAHAGPYTDALGTVWPQATSVFEIDVASGTIGQQVTIGYHAAATSPRYSPARVFIDSFRPTLAYVLQPCNLQYKQQLTRINLATNPWTVSLPINLPADYCLDAPGANANRAFALGTLGSLLQVSELVRINTGTGGLSFLGDSPVGFRRAPSSPYVLSRVSNHLYALNDAQNLLAEYNLLTGDVSTVPVTVATPCVRGSITSFASPY